MGRRARAQRGDAGSSPGSDGRWVAVMFVVAWLAVGLGCIGVGISNVRHAHEIGAHGVPAVARVVANDGYGRDDIAVTYPTATGRVVRGVLRTGREAYHYRVGSLVDVRYDPRHPSIVAFASVGGSTAGGRQDIEVGVGDLVVVPALVGLLAWQARRSSRRKARRPARQSA